MTFFKTLIRLSRGASPIGKPMLFLGGVILVIFVALALRAVWPRTAEKLVEIHAPRAVAHVSKNLSGLTWNQESGTLFAVTNSPQYLLELTPEGMLLRRVALRGFKDTEGVTHIKGRRFALVEERRGALCLIDLPVNATELQRDDATCLDLGTTKPKNKGLESVTYDPKTRTLHTMREGKPFVCLSIPLDEHFRPGPVHRTPLPELDVKDVASIIRDPDGTLWVLSEASSRLVQLDHNGQELRSFMLRNTGASFRPEGITRCPDGRIFVVGEPNILAGYQLPE